MHAQSMYHKFFEELAFTDEQKLDIQQAAKQADKRSLTLELERAIKLRDVQKVGTILLQGFQTFGPVCPLVLIQSCYELVCNLYRDLCIEESVRVATLSDISLWTEVYAHDHSQETGFAQVFWIARHLCAKILRLGRLQFEQKSMNSPLRIYQRERSEHCITLAEADIACDSAGYLINPEQAAFMTTLREEGTSLIAHAVDGASGSIARQPSLYDTSRLRLLADSATNVLHIHIPAGEKLSEQAVADSLLQAPRYFPNHSLAVCTSWLLDPALLSVAEPSSNIVLFMQRFSKFPVPFQTPQIFERVFGFTATEDDIPRWKATTTLQRSIQRALSEGVVFRTMGGYLLLG